MAVDQQEPIRGTTAALSGRQPGRVDAQRWCAEPSCATRLSAYNPTSHCWIHEEPHPFVLDGVRRRRDEPREPSADPRSAA